MQPFFSVSVTLNGVKYRDESWDNVRFYLQKTNGGDKKTDGEYVDLIRGWVPGEEDECLWQRDVRPYKDFVDMELFTYAEVLEIKQYFFDGYENARIAACLFLDFPAQSKEPYEAITTGRGRDFFKFFTRPGYSLRFQLIGQCDFEDGQAARRIQIPELLPGEISF